MNKQEIFDKVVSHLLLQGRRSVNDENNGCLYRGHGGTMCAVGCLITDEHYNAGLEGLPVDVTSVRKALVDSGVRLDGDTLGMLISMQCLHDEADCYTNDALSFREHILKEAKQMADFAELEWNFDPDDWV